MELSVVLEDDYFQMLSNIKAIGALKKKAVYSLAAKHVTS